MDLSCLQNYIGIKGGAMAPPSGIFINELPGMCTEMVTDIADCDYAGFADVWADVQKRSFRRFRNDLINAILENHNADFRNITYQTRRLLKTQRNAVVVPALAEYRGVYISLPESKYSSFRINEVYAYSDTAVSTTFKVFDLNDGTVLHTQNVSLAVGLNTIPVQKEFDLKYRIFELFAGIDYTGAASIETQNDYYYWYNNLDYACGHNCNHGGYVTGVFQIYPATLDKTLSATYDHVIKTGIGKGVSLGAEVLCSIEQLICENKHHFEQSLLYLLGSEMLTQKLSSYRLNYFASTNLEITDANRIEFEKRYKSTLKNDVKSLSLAGESICFDCSDSLEITTKGALP